MVEVFKEDCMDDEPANPVPLSLAALLESLAALIDRLHGGMAGMLLRAVPVKSSGTGGVYGGSIYARRGEMAEPR